MNLNPMNPMLGLHQQQNAQQQMAQGQNMMNALRQSAGALKQTMNMLNGSANPMQMMSALGNTNPNMGQVNNYIQQCGGDSKKAFYNLANQLGLNGDEVLGLLK